MKIWVAVILGMTLLGCSENYKQRASSLSFGNSQITDGVLTVYSFSEGKRGKLLQSYFFKDGKSNFDGLNFSEDYLLLELTEFTYVDPFTEKKVFMAGGQSWTTIITPSYENSKGFVMNPITTLISAYVEALVKQKSKSRDEALSIAIENFQDHFGSVDLLQTQPVPLSNGSLSPGEVYQLALTGFSKLASEINMFSPLNYTSKELLHDLLNDIKDGYFDGLIFDEPIEVQNYLFDQFVFNYKFKDALASYLSASNFSFKDSTTAASLKNTIKSLDRSFFKPILTNDTTGPVIDLLKPVNGNPVGNGFPILVNFTDESGPLAETHVFYDNHEVSDSNSSSFIFQGIINNTNVPDGVREFRVEATDIKGNSSSKIIQVISDNTLPVLNFLVDGNLPNTSFYMAGTVDMEATLQDNNMVGSIEITSDNATFNSLIHDNNPDDGVFHSVVDTTQVTTNSLTMTLHVKGWDYAGNEVSQDYQVTIWNRGPQITIDYPLEGKTFHNGDVIVAHATALTGSVATFTGALIDSGVTSYLTDGDVTVPGFSYSVNFGGADDFMTLHFEATDDKGRLNIKEIQVEYNDHFFQYHRSTGYNVPDISQNLLWSNSYDDVKRLVVSKSVQGSSLYTAYMKAYTPSFRSFPINYFDTGNFSLPPMVLDWYSAWPTNYITSIPGNPDRARVCNINNDSYEDIVYAGMKLSPQTNAFFVNMGPQDTNGLWAIDYAVDVTTGNTDYMNLSCFDFNEDGYDDVLANSTIFYGPNFNTTADFNTVAGLNSADFLHGLQQIGDVDGDGHQDYLLLYKESTNGNRYFLPIYGPITGVAGNTGVAIPTNINLVDASGVLQDDAMSASGKIGDVNGDGIDDFVIAKTVLAIGVNTGGSFDLYYGKVSRTGAWGKITKNQLGAAVSINSFMQTCDVDGNGFMDVVFRNYNTSNGTANVGIALGPTFDANHSQLRSWPLDHTATTDLICKDINNDGKGDIIVYTTENDVFGTYGSSVGGYLEVLHD